MSDELAIEASGLVKAFGTKRAIDGIDLSVRRGSVFAMLGPNGAGKTTTVRVLATLLPPDEGTVRVLGHDVAGEANEVRRRISLTGQFASVDEDLTGRENLRLLGMLLGFKSRIAKNRADELLEAFGLSEAANQTAKTYSGGMRRRLDIASSIVAMPDLLFLDEPTTGLDPRSRNQVWDIVRHLTDVGTTVLLTTQYLQEADELADRIAVIDRGKVIAEGTSTDLKASVGRGVMHVRLVEAGDRERAMALLSSKLETPAHTDRDSRAFTLSLPDMARAAGSLSALSEAGIAVSDFSLGQPSLDEVFFSLTGRGVDGGAEKSGEGA